MSITHDDVARVLKEAEIEAKKVARQQLKTEGVQAKVLEKHRQAEDMIDQLAKANAARRVVAEKKFLATRLQNPQVWTSMEASNEHWELCGGKGYWSCSRTGKPAMAPKEYFPVPRHPEATPSSNYCPFCVGDLWKKCYDSVSQELISHT